MSFDKPLPDDVREKVLALPHLKTDERRFIEERLDLPGKADTLSGLERQTRFLLERALEPLMCPGCSRAVPEIAARTKDMPGDADHQCPHCQSHLTYHVALIGGEQFWSLSAGQTVQIREAPNA